MKSRPIVKTRFNIRMDVASEFVSNDRQLLVAASHRSVRVHDDNSARDIQLNVLGSTYIRSGCIRAERLEKIQQLCESSIRVTEQSVGLNSKSEGLCHSYSSVLARTNVVSETSSNDDRYTYKTANIKQNSVRGRTQGGALKEQGLGNLRLEGLWRSRLRCIGWTKHAATRTVNSSADSTYNVYTGAFH